MPQSLLTGQLKEKPTYRVWCLYSSLVHGCYGTCVGVDSGVDIRWCYILFNSSIGSHTPCFSLDFIGVLFVQHMQYMYKFIVYMKRISIWAVCDLLSVVALVQEGRILYTIWGHLENPMPSLKWHGNENFNSDFFMNGANSNDWKMDGLL